MDSNAVLLMGLCLVFVLPIGTVMLGRLLYGHKFLEAPQDHKKDHRDDLLTPEHERSLSELQQALANDDISPQDLRDVRHSLHSKR